MELLLNIEAPVVRPEREQMFNFKDNFGQLTFREITNSSAKLRKSFKYEGVFLEKAAKFHKTLQDVFQQSFKKVRGTKRKMHLTEIDLLMNERKRIKSDKKDKTGQNINSLENIEKNIAKKISEKNRNKIMKSFQEIANSDDSCNTLGMWRQVRKVFPKVLASVPLGLKDHKGKILTKSSDVKQPVIRKYQQRLRKRPPNPHIKELMKITE